MGITGSPPVAGCLYPHERGNLTILLLERLFDCNRDGDGSADHGREMRSISDGNNKQPAGGGLPLYPWEGKSNNFTS